MFKNKKGAAIAIVAIILSLTILGWVLVNFSLRDCNNNTDCPSNAYCGSDYECHEFPQQIIVKESNFIPASLILGTMLLISVILFKMDKLPFVKKE